jgi:hypothetical protein
MIKLAHFLTYEVTFPCTVYNFTIVHFNNSLLTTKISSTFFLLCHNKKMVFINGSNTFMHILIFIIDVFSVHSIYCRKERGKFLQKWLAARCWGFSTLFCSERIKILKYFFHTFCYFKTHFCIKKHNWKINFLARKHFLCKAGMKRVWGQTVRVWKSRVSLHSPHIIALFCSPPSHIKGMVTGSREQSVTALN